MTMQINPDSVPGVQISNRKSSESRAGYGGRIQVHVTGDSTGGAFGMWEGVIPAGGTTPMHIHHNEDEGIYIMEGTFHMKCGDEEWESGPGSWLLMPKGVQHGFKIVGDTPGRFLEVFLPAGLEKLFLKLPDAKSNAKPDMAKILATAKAFGIEFVGPFPS